VYLPPKVLDDGGGAQRACKGGRLGLSPWSGFTRPSGAGAWAGEDEFSIDLARQGRPPTAWRGAGTPPGDVDLVVLLQTSPATMGRSFRFSLEPTTASRLQKEFGFVNTP